MLGDMQLLPVCPPRLLAVSGKEGTGVYVEQAVCLLTRPAQAAAAPQDGDDGADGQGDACGGGWDGREAMPGCCAEGWMAEKMKSGGKRRYFPHSHLQFREHLLESGRPQVSERCWHRSR